LVARTERKRLPRQYPGLYANVTPRGDREKWREGGRGGEKWVPETDERLLTNRLVRVGKE